MIKKIVICFLTVLFSANLALATSTIDLPKAGLTPNSPFYFLDTIDEKISLFFTFDKVKKAQKAEKFSEEKLAEAKQMSDDNTTDKIDVALNKYDEYLNEAIDDANTAKDEGKNVDEVLATVSEAIQKHLVVLAEVYAKVPEQAKSAIQNAITNSSKGQENALKAISGEKKTEVQNKINDLKKSPSPNQGNGTTNNPNR